MLALIWIPVVFNLMYWMSPREVGSIHVDYEQKGPFVVFARRSASCGSKFTWNTQLWDTRTGELKSFQRSSELPRLVVNDDGDRFIDLSEIPDAARPDCVVLRRLSETAAAAGQPLEIPGLGRSRQLVWLAEDQILYWDSRGRLRVFDLANKACHEVHGPGLYDDLATSSIVPLSNDVVLVYRVKSKSLTTYQIRGNAAHRIGSYSYRHNFIGCFRDGRKIWRWRPNAGHEVVQIETGDVIATFGLSSRTRYSDIAGADTVVSFLIDAAGLIDQVVLHDANTGKETRLIELPPKPNWRLGGYGKFLYTWNRMELESWFQTIDGKRSLHVLDPRRVREPWQACAVLLSLLWWIVWAITRRGTRRSYWVGLDVAILILMAFSSTLGLTSPVESRFYSIDAATFLAASASLIAMVAFWIAFAGEMTWPNRVTFGLLAVALVLWITRVWFWSSERAVREDAIPDLMIFSTTGLLCTFAVARWFGVRLTHCNDGVVSTENKTMNVRALFVWTSAVGIVYFVISASQWAPPIPGKMQLTPFDGEITLSVGLACIAIATMLRLSPWVGVIVTTLVGLIVCVGSASAFGGSIFALKSYAPRTFLNPGGSFVYLFSIELVLIALSAGSTAHQRVQAVIPLVGQDSG